MATFRARKVVSALPTPLEPDTVYAVRVGEGFDLYISDKTGTLAHKVNGGAAGGWATIATSSITATNTLVFSSIPSTFSDILLVLHGAKQASGSSKSISALISGDNGSDLGGGTNWAALVNNTNYTTGFIIHNYRAPASFATFFSALISGSATDMNSVGLSTSTQAYLCTSGPINYLRVSLSSAATFVASGTATLYGRV